MGSKEEQTPDIVPSESPGSASAWKRIEDVLPPLQEDVLFCWWDEEGECFTAVQSGFYEGEKTEGDAIVMLQHDDRDDWYPASHWRAMPDPPAKP